MKGPLSSDLVHASSSSSYSSSKLTKIIFVISVNIKWLSLLIHTDKATGYYVCTAYSHLSWKLCIQTHQGWCDEGEFPSFLRFAWVSASCHSWLFPTTALDSPRALVWCLLYICLSVGCLSVCLSVWWPFFIRVYWASLCRSIVRLCTNSHFYCSNLSCGFPPKSLYDKKGVWIILMLLWIVQALIVSQARVNKYITVVV